MYGKYNTAVKGRKDEVGASHKPESLEPYEDGNGIVSLTHNICEGAHEAFKACDCIYSEIAWQAGYGRFTEGTEAEGSSHADYLDGIVRCIEGLQVPAFIVCGKREAKRMQPDAQKDIAFMYHGGSRAVLAAWNAAIPDYVESELDARGCIIGEHSCVLDPCCGYGNTARIAVQAGKRGIMSDVNAECIAYIRSGGYLNAR